VAAAKPADLAEVVVRFVVTAMAPLSIRETPPRKPGQHQVVLVQHGVAGQPVVESVGSPRGIASTYWRCRTADAMGNVRRFGKVFVKLAEPPVALGGYRDFQPARTRRVVIVHLFQPIVWQQWYITDTGYEDVDHHTVSLAELEN